MDPETAKTLPEDTPVTHKGRGPGVWLGIDRWDKETCYVRFEDGDEARVSLNLVEVR